MRPLNLLIIVAHPDGEAIGAGGLLRGYPDATVVHVTDGGGGDLAAVLSRGFASREDYAAARRQEVLGYERCCVRISGAERRAMAEQALAALRLRRSARSR